MSLKVTISWTNLCRRLQGENQLLKHDTPIITSVSARKFLPASTTAFAAIAIMQDTSSQGVTKTQIAISIAPNQINKNSCKKNPVPSPKWTHKNHKSNTALKCTQRSMHTISKCHETPDKANSRNCLPYYQFKR